MLLEQEADSAEFPLHSCRDETVRTAVAFIRNNIRQKLPVDTICQAVGTNPSTLNFRFRRELSCSVGAFITGERISLARRLLRSTTYSIGAIAQQCGYDNIYYFSTAFGKATGCSPSAYRAQHR